jgi:hypothetical protein
MYGLEMKYEKSYWIQTVTRINISHRKSRGTKRSHTHLHDSVPFHSLLVQIIPPAALKMRMLLAVFNSHNPLCGHCPLNPKDM